MAEDAQAFYSRWAHLYDLLARQTPGIAGLRRQTAEACRLEPGDTVVEMGCGTGANLPFLREQVGIEGTVVGIDFTRVVLDRARALTAKYDNVHVVRGDATSPPVGTDVDAVLATFVVGMLETPGDAVDDWCDLVGNGGHVVLANATRSRAWHAPVTNAVFRGVVVASTPPTTKIRYDQDPVESLDDRVDTAHRRLRERATAIAEERRALGFVRLTGGRIGDESSQ